MIPDKALIAVLAVLFVLAIVGTIFGFLAYFESSDVPHELVADTISHSSGGDITFHDNLDLQGNSISGVQLLHVDDVIASSVGSLTASLVFSDDIDMDGHDITGVSDVELPNHTEGNLLQAGVSGHIESSSLAASEVVTKDGTQTLTNKTVDFTSNSVLYGSDTSPYVSNTTSAVAQWATSTKGTGTVVTLGSAVDGDGNTYVTGYFTGTVDFMGLDVISAGNEDMFLVKYNSSGTPLWVARSTLGASNEQGHGVAVDVDGNVYVVGHTTGTATIAGVALTSPGTQAMFLAKYTSAGTASWAVETVAGTGSEFAYDVAVGPDGHPHVCGSYDSDFTVFGTTVLLSNGGTDMFVAKFDKADGSGVWATANSAGPTTTVASSIKVDTSGNSYITGYYDGTTTIVAGTPLTSTNEAAFWAKFSNLGVASLSSGSTGTPNARGSVIALSPDEMYVYQSGYLATGTTALAGESLVATGTNDAFLAKYSAVTALPEWVVQNRWGPSSDQTPKVALAVDSDGDPHIAGNFSHDIVIAGVSLVNAKPGTDDVFLAKFNGSDGVGQWATSSGSSEGVVNIVDIGMDSSNAVYLTGTAATTGAKFDYQAISEPLGGGDSFVVKYVEVEEPRAAVKQLNWVQHSSLGTLAEGATSVAVDRDRNVFVVGYFSGTTTIAGTALSARGQMDMFLAKYGPDGTGLWAIQPTAGATLDERANAVDVDSYGNVYIAGYFQGSATIAGVSLTATAAEDIFVAKYGGDGTGKWAVKGSGAGSEEALAMAVDWKGEVYVTGFLTDDFTIGGSTVTHIAGTDDTFLFKLDTNGVVRWADNALSADSGGIDRGLSIAMSNDTVYVVGSFTTANIEIGGLTVLLGTAAETGFIARYNASTGAAFAGSAITPTAGQTCRVTGVAADYRGAYITGHASGNITFPGGLAFTTTDTQVNAFTAHISRALNTSHWLAQSTGSTTAQGWDIAVDENGNVYTVGFIEGTSVIAGQTLTTSGTRDMFFAKYDKGGNALTAKSSDYTTGADEGLAIAVDATEDVFVAGTFSGNATIGGIDVTAAGSTDMFVAKFSEATYAMVQSGSNLYGEGSVVNGLSGMHEGHVYYLDPDSGTVSWKKSPYVLGIANSPTSLYVRPYPSVIHNYYF